MRKSLLVAFLTGVLVFGFVIGGALRFGVVQAATEVIGIITSDTTWTKANSPYNLTGPTAVGEGVTLTIEAGATVNLNGYYIQVNGTLVARGTSADQIHFSSGQIKFTHLSIGWNEQTGKGSIIEKAIFSQITDPSGSSQYFPEIIIDDSSPKIVDTTNASSIQVNGGSPIICQNVLGNMEIKDGAPEVSDNTIWAVLIYAGNPIISSNKIEYGINPHENPDATYGSPIIRDNTITFPGATDGVVMYLASTGTPIISHNNITGLVIPTHYDEFGRPIGPYYTPYGIRIEGNAIISNNIISGCTVASITLSPKNGQGNIMIQNNTIAGHNVFNSKGIIINGLVSAEINYNNIQGGIYLSEGAANDVNATYNWWGTTDTQAISQSIHDFDDDFNLGKVTFVPFLTEPNPEASEVPTPTPTPTSTPPPTSTPLITPSPPPTPTPSQEPQQTDQTEAIIGVAIIVAVLGAGLGLLIYLIKRK